MRPTATGIQTKGVLGGEKIALSIDLDSMKFIMQQLTDLYSDPALAVIREYSTNAADSHVEAGTTLPIEISTPNRMSPYFKVRDYGIGLDDVGIRDTYSKYGASTKRDTDSQVGMLGFGCKSGLTYTDQVLISSWKDGKAYSAILKRDADGSASIQIVDIRDSSEPTGVEITIMVKDQYEFNEKISEFYKFWQPGTVIVNGTAPTGFKGMEKIAEGIYYDPERRGDYVVMGNVPYRTNIPSQLTRSSYRYNFSIVVIAPVGSVDFPPSREELQMTPRTKAFLTDAGSRFDKALVAKVEKDIAQAASPSKAVASAYEWKNRLGANCPGLKYNGKDIPFSFYVQDPAPKSIGMTYNRADTSGRSFRLNENMSGGEYISAEVDFGYNYIKDFEPKTCVIVTGWEMKKFTSLHVRKIRMYLEKLGMVNPPTQAPNSNYYYGKQISVWISRDPNIMRDGWLDEHATHIKWADITDMKLPRQKKAAVPSYYVHTILDAKPEFIDATKPIFWKTNGWNGHNSTAINAKQWLFTILPKDSQLVILSERRVDKFRKAYPSAQPISDAVTAAAATYVSKLPKEIVDKVANSGVLFNAAVERLDYRKVVDPDLAAELQMTNVIPKGWDDFENCRQGFHNWGVRLPMNRAMNGRRSKYESRYPLVPYLNYNAPMDLVLTYISTIYNQKYATNRKGI